MRVVIGEDLALLRDGLIRLFEANGCTVVAAVEDEPALRDALLTEELDVAIVDVRLPPTFTDEGLRAAIEARRAALDEGADAAVADVVSLEDGVRTYLYTKFELVTVRVS